MSLSVRPTRRVASRSITRSQSFAGVNSYDKPYRSLSVFSTPGCTRKTASRSSRMFTLSAKSPPPKVPQPERLDEVYEALKRGLQSYLQVHQAELENLSRQMKESKRNSRLGFLYELDKQVKVIERFMRRLEFHLSKIDELYEAYCMQRRLRDGANKMVKAYTASTGSREARESLSEANKGFKEYTENMCMLESELESQLGEFHIKMKGLAGFARLCAGDQYEIFMKYGRQRWKLKGRIEINGRQVWDSEEMVFLPLITEFLSIKVTELKSLANHVVVGSVSCETKDLFTALPQTVAVDINDLGTIKLSLEVTWNPFDKDDQASTASTVNKAPTVNKRFSTYNQSPPDTPSLREQAFYTEPRGLSQKQRWSLLDVFRDTLAERLSQSCSCGDVTSVRFGSAPLQSDNMLRRQEEMENGTAWSNSSESSDDSSSPQLSLGMRHAHKNLVQPEIQAAAPAIEISFALRESATSTPTRLADQKEEEDEDEEEDEVIEKDESSVKEAEVPNGHTRFSRSFSHISETSADGALADRAAGEAVEPSEVASLVSVDNDMDRPNRAEASEPSHTAEPVNRSDGSCSSPADPATQDNLDNSEAVPEDKPTDTEQAGRASPRTEISSQPCGTTAAPDRPGSVVETQPMDSEELQTPDGALEDSLTAVMSSLDDYRGQFPELQVLEQELRLLEEVLTGRSRSRSSSVSLTVETVLGSFDFLNTSDLEEEAEAEDEQEEDGEKKIPADSECHSAPDRPADESAGEDEGCEERCWETPSGPLSTGCLALDRVLQVHLKNCSSKLLRLGTFGPLRCGEMYALDQLLRETRVLELIRRVTKDNADRIIQPEEVVPQLDQCQGAVSLWKQCTDGSSVYSTSTEAFLQTLGTSYTSRVPERVAGLTDTVFVHLVERILQKKLPKRGGGAAREMITIFQFWSYLEAEGVVELDTHITELAEEVWLVQSLQSGDQDVLVKALKKPLECSLKREGLRAVSLLLRDPRGKVCSAASSLLRSLADQTRHRERALVSCLELLEDECLETRVCGCKALACLKAKESIEQLVYLCRTDKEDVRDAAKQALLVLGEEGKMAHRHVETSQEGMPRLFTPGSMASTAF
ncbi:rho family-interacting cell polarization regulator 1 isoform X3 [Denticeps clupeoides]|uniref:FAM65 N-terminal domain-containing protein n=2 Tax=Denticeps clupeoides TaxID=299321 RepID=A0AAY4ESK6_9TELE|nr:rho family-interacting cell polarization regulator 1 isoform X3 [Denticeps clupeoides]XP_028814542.1 rho family-interacting cell polarization regulator 1 isoform X3 [Denticeps clupeoides]XP_028814544.1 rho family-interacting cell polarization regulator 1 isoform X3 [Denticeps clupeoides]